jgi:hypothetical protein
MLTSKAGWLFIAGVVMLSVAQWLGGRRGLWFKTPRDIQASMVTPMPPFALALRRAAFLVLFIAVICLFESW